MNSIIVQVPMDKSLKASAQKVAEEMGFGSLQDAIRLFLAQLAKKTINISFTEQFPDEVLTSTQEKVLARKYRQAMKEMKAGKGITTSSIDEMMKFLRT